MRFNLAATRKSSAQSRLVFSGRERLEWRTLSMNMFNKLRCACSRYSYNFPFAAAAYIVQEKTTDEIGRTKMREQAP